MVEEITSILEIQEKDLQSRSIMSKIRMCIFGRKCKLLK